MVCCLMVSLREQGNYHLTYFLPIKVLHAEDSPFLFTKGGPYDYTPLFIRKVHFLFVIVFISLKNGPFRARCSGNLSSSHGCMVW